jgi:hypothetical protein
VQQLVGVVVVVVLRKHAQGVMHGAVAQHNKMFSHGRQPVKREQRVYKLHPASHALFDLSSKVLRAHAAAVPSD